MTTNKKKKKTHWKFKLKNSSRFVLKFVQKFSNFKCKLTTSLIFVVQKNDSLECLELIQVVCSQISNFIKRFNMRENDQKTLKKCDENLEKIENLFDKNSQQVSKLRNLIKDLLSPDEKQWKSWSADQFFRYFKLFL